MRLFWQRRSHQAGRLKSTCNVQGVVLVGTKLVQGEGLCAGLLVSQGFRVERSQPTMGAAAASCRIDHFRKRSTEELKGVS